MNVLELIQELMHYPLNMEVLHINKDTIKPFRRQLRRPFDNVMLLDLHHDDDCDCLQPGDPIRSPVIPWDGSVKK